MKKGTENMNKKTIKNIFYKTNPRVGISLIVLVITIIVIIILAAAVIVSLQNNNPMAEANRARYESDVSNMQMIFTNVVGKIMAEKQEIIGIKPCQLNSVTKGVKSTEGEVTYTINGEDAGKIIFTNEASENKNDYITGKKLPIYNNETIWNVDDEGILRVGVGKNTYPNNDGSGGSGTTGGTTTTPDNGESVTISKEEYDNLKASIDLMKTEQAVIKNNYEALKSDCNIQKTTINNLNTTINNLNTEISTIKQSISTPKSSTFSVSKINGNKNYLSQIGKVVSIEINGNSGSRNIVGSQVQTIATGLPKPVNNNLQELVIKLDDPSQYARAWVSASGTLDIFISAVNYTGNIYIGGTYISQ